MLQLELKLRLGVVHLSGMIPELGLSVAKEERKEESEEGVQVHK